MYLDPSDVSPTLGEMGLIGTGVVVTFFHAPFVLFLHFCFLSQIINCFLKP